MAKTLTVGYTIEDSKGAACHGYKEHEWQGYASVTDEDGTERDHDDLTTEEKVAFSAVDAVLKPEGWDIGGAHGEFLARIDYGRVPAAKVDDHRAEVAQNCADRVEEVLKQHFHGYEVEVIEA